MKVCGVVKGSTVEGATKDLTVEGSMLERNLETPWQIQTSCSVELGVV